MDFEVRRSPVVLISGGGLGGLLLGILLERAGIQYHIFERASIIKPLGSVMVLGSTILPVFEQLGLLEDLERFAVPFKSTTLHSEKTDGKLKQLAILGMKNEKDIAGYQSQTFVRHQLYNLLLSRIPPENITLGKKVLKVVERDDRIMIYCSDKSAYVGDILVGADGSYSAIRQCIYREMAKEKLLPKADAEDLVAGYTCMVGATTRLDVEKYPKLIGDHCQSEAVLGCESRSWSCWGISDHRICWSLKVQYKTLEEAKRQMFMSSSWHSGSHPAMIKEFENLPCPLGGTLGDLFEMTPKGTISKVYLEHKMYTTWYYKRSVLLGDACHKMLPAAGQGAVNALQDAVILANCLYDLEDVSQESVTAAFKRYYDQRYTHAKTQFENSELAAKITTGLNWTDRWTRTLYLNLLPPSAQQGIFAKTTTYQPQVAFLPLVPFRGTGTVLPQVPSTRYTAEQESYERGGKEKMNRRASKLEIEYPADICFLPPRLQ
ncbi:hypothetical protein EMPS_03737 [Entomortierella parvispora]|uniref:FAD-binding domain-containing protein n=1 Tax=Entomortierella parvispora TaxID=205924 RepID=A0A9P3H7Y2_9FUNG|nr:hypothetical protein EMPS_03737 [Entomortierella parvispora]